MMLFLFRLIIQVRLFLISSITVHPVKTLMAIYKFLSLINHGNAKNKIINLRGSA